MECIRFAMMHIAHLEYHCISSVCVCCCGYWQCYFLWILWFQYNFPMYYIINRNEKQHFERFPIYQYYRIGNNRVKWFRYSAHFHTWCCVCAPASNGSEGSFPAADGIKFNWRSRANAERANALAQKLIHMLWADSGHMYDNMSLCWAPVAGLVNVVFVAAFGWKSDNNEKIVANACSAKRAARVEWVA